MTASRVWDNGFRQITTSTRPIRTPEDLRGLKIRVPPAPMLTSLFKALGAGPSPINFNELYSALQTKVVEGQENPLADHRDDPALRGPEILQPDRPRLGRLLDPGNRRAWGRLPDDIRAVVEREFDRSAAGRAGRHRAAERVAAPGPDRQRAAVQRRGPEPFREALRKTSFYQDWKAKYGDEAWTNLEQVAGKLV